MQRTLLAAALILLAASARAMERSFSVPTLNLPAAVTLAPAAQPAVLPAAVSAVNAAEAISPLAAAPQAQAMTSISASGIIEASAKGTDTKAVSAASSLLFDNSLAKGDTETSAVAAPSRSGFRSFLGKAAATITAVAAVPAVAAAQTQASSAAAGDRAASLIFLAIGVAAFGWMVFDALFGDRAERKAAKAYVAKNAAAILALPGVMKAKATMVLASPWGGSIPGVEVYYGLGADRKAIEAALPAPGGVMVNVVPQFSKKEAARDYVKSYESKIRAIAGVEDVRVGSIDQYAGPAGVFTEPGVVVRYAKGADPKAIEAALPSSVNGVEIELRPR